MCEPDLPGNPIITDSVGWPCLKFYNSKMACEQLVPLSQRAAEAILGQFFIVVLVARLVGIQVTQEGSGKSDDDRSN